MGNRDLHGHGPFASERMRDRADAARQIEGLSQGDQVIALLTRIDERLTWLCEFLYRQAEAESD